MGLVRGEGDVFEGEEGVPEVVEDFELGKGERFVLVGKRDAVELVFPL